MEQFSALLAFVWGTHRLIPLTKASDFGALMFYWSGPEQASE